MRKRHTMTLAPFFFDVLHLDGDDLLDRTLAERAADPRRGSSANGASRRSRPTIQDAAEAFLADALASGHEGVMVKALDSRYEAGRRRRGVAQGQAGPHARSRRARRRVGTRAPTGLALQSPSRRARSGHRRVRDGRQDVQGTHRPAPHLANGAAARASQRDATTTPCTCVPSSSSRSRSTACRCRRATRAAWP